jgi:hypothetical protein
MKIANICPTDCVNLFITEKERYHLALASQVLASTIYANFYMRARLRGDFVILDNDAYEQGKSLSLEALITAAKAINPSMLVLPDDMNADAADNLGLATAALNKLVKVFPKDTQYMAVPHGKSMERYMQCADHFVNSYGGWVTCLGVYKNAARDLRVSRQYIVEKLADYPIALHLLGVTDDRRDLLVPYMRQRVMGADTCRFVQQGLRNIRDVPYEDQPEYAHRDGDYFSIPQPERHSSSIGTTFENITAWREACAW